MWRRCGPRRHACEMTRETLDADDVAGLKSLYGGSSTTTLTPPTAPSGLTAAAAAADPTGSIALAWTDNSTNESGYRVERSADGVTFGQIAQLGTGATAYADSGLVSGARYYYRTYAYNSAGVRRRTRTSRRLRRRPRQHPLPRPHRPRRQIRLRPMARPTSARA